MEAKNRKAYQVRDKIATGKLTPGALAKFDSGLPRRGRTRMFSRYFSGFSSQHSLVSTHVRETKQIKRIDIYTTNS